MSEPPSLDKIAVCARVQLLAAGVCTRSSKPHGPGRCSATRRSSHGDCRVIGRQEGWRRGRRRLMPHGPVPRPVWSPPATGSTSGGIRVVVLPGVCLDGRISRSPSAPIRQLTRRSLGSRAIAAVTTVGSFPAWASLRYRPHGRSRAFHSVPPIVLGRLSWRDRCSSADADWKPITPCRLDHSSRCVRDLALLTHFPSLTRLGKCNRYRILVNV
jgi:hypothetical protein